MASVLSNHAQCSLGAPTSSNVNWDVSDDKQFVVSNSISSKNTTVSLSGFATLV